MKSYAPNTSNELEYAAAIQVGAKPGPDADQARWTFLLTLFFRAVALLWIVEGLDQWRRILSPASPFLEVSNAVAAAVIFFAVLDLVAAVGLWMVAPWGGVVWLLTLMAQLYVSVMKPAFFTGGGLLVKVVNGVLLATYLFLSWRANRANDETGAADRLSEGAFSRAWAWARRKERTEPPARETRQG